ncbi:zinc/manganese transport system substrate-binding protein [Prosthecobacter fusiformis]|uniref:Zinc/manganese transport system substrate-binding protein n=1 Tax=Prosthecobacter fusiformis TaxID=48464 RepID=A0A4R7SPI5_9BACT|nr:metal ABC transporter substrate-binding protein [Prosthecobacter fusiformis]TDU81122.1 zinc/manganese transport system substrate-binding protein [Prosthecobacter fusiformis]
MKTFASILLLLGLSMSAQAAVKVASLHPILADVARQVGGANVEVVEVLKAGGDVHHFEPSARDIAAMRGAPLILACGKHLETYLDKLRDSVGSGVKIVEVGKPIPSLLLDPSNEIFVCCPAHAKSSIDPHWWHSAENMKRAARIIADELSAVDPANGAAYEAGAKAAGVKFMQLKSWAQKEIARIPRSDRKLVTAHAAFGYFCKEYGFKTIPMLGIGRSDDISAQYIAQTIQAIRDNKIKAVFPEDQANPKVLTEIVRSTGVKTGQALVADGTSVHAHTFEAMLTHNVRAIVAALGGQ